MDRLIQNVRLGIRSLRRTPGFSIAAVLTLAIGIGLATAVFTVANALLLRALPVRDQDRLVLLWGETKNKQRFDHFPLGFLRTQDLTQRTSSFERVAYVGYEGAAEEAIREGDQIVRLRRSLVSGEFFDVLGAQSLIGRSLRPADDAPGAAPVVVLSYTAWQRRFGGGVNVLGRRVVLHADGLTYTVVGVMPQGLDLPRGTDMWAAITPSVPDKEMPFRAFDVIGRMAPHATVESARSELTRILTRSDSPAWERDLRGVVRLLSDVVLGDTRPALLVFAVAAALLLLITCINVANLLLVRGLARTREMALRNALGATRGQVISLLLAENAVLAVIGGAFGVAVAAGAVRTFIAFAPADVPRLDEIHLNLTALTGALCITGVAMLLFALAPAIMTSRVTLQHALRSDSRHGARRGSRRLTEALVAGQVALALLVLSAAGLIAKSLLKLEHAELSFDGSHLLIGELALSGDRYDNAAKQTAMLEQLVSALKATPGIRSVSPVVAVPFSGSHGWDGSPSAEGQSADDAKKNPMLNMEVVNPEYFETFGVPICKGRGFTESDRDGAPAVVVVSQSTARLYWPNEAAVGKRLFMSPNRKTVLTVVGLVPDTRYRDLRESRPSIYFPLRQSFFPFAPLTLAIRVSGSPEAMVPGIRRVIEAGAPGVALASAASFESLRDRPLAQPRLHALLLAVFATAAVVLAAVGLFGVMTTMVRQRTRELGVRMALGATAGDVKQMVVRRGLAIAVSGVGIGLLGSVAANRLLASLLYDVSPTDIATLCLVAAVLFSVALIASVIPARVSARIEPAIALRGDG